MSRLFYRQPAEGDWERALPIGNGKLGAMIFGESTMEHCQINEDSLWSGGPMERVNPEARENLAKVRERIFAGEIPEAERLMKYAFTGTPQSERVYQTLGDLYIDLMDTVVRPEEYERELDLETALHRVKVRDGITGITFFREAFASAPGNVIVIRLTADRPGSVSAAAMVSRQVFYDRTWHEKDMVFMEGSTGENGIGFCAGIKLVAPGPVRALGEHLVAEHVDHATVILTAATTYREEDPVKYVRETLQRAASTPYREMREEHIREYKSYFDTCRLALAGDSTLDEMPTDGRLAQDRPDNGLVNIYFDYGRYLLISCSRPGSLPANLQGIWNDQMSPPWGSKYTININTEMNYWPAESLGLSKCHRPLFDHLKKMADRGEKTARDMYGCRGFVAHHNTDIWADTAPQDMWNPATYWVMGGAWLCTHIWQHYLYTGDKDFLREMYPVMKKSVLFFMDFLVEHEGYLVTCPSVSPENTYILPDGTRGCHGYGVTMDNSILRDLFCQYLQAADALGERDRDFVCQAEETLEKLPPIQVGSEGQILEWVSEYREAEPGHRHISHLYALHPSSQIQPDTTPELARAARKTLQRRLENGGGHTGWSRAWIINMYARLWEGENAYGNLVALLKKSTLPNLLDFHPPFQIDGNFGAIAAIGEMLLQSDERRTVILPALPEEWPEGEIRGIRGVGGVVYDFQWRDGRVTALTARAAAEVHTVLMIQGKRWPLDLKEGEIFCIQP